MTTAKAHNAPQIGHYEFREHQGTVTMIGGPEHGRDIMTTLFEACGWKVKFAPRRLKVKRKK